MVPVSNLLSVFDTPRCYTGRFSPTDVSRVNIYSDSWASLRFPS